MSPRRFALLLLACLGFGQSLQQLPSWLVPYPGSNPQMEVTQNLVESSYTTEASIQQVLDRLRNAFNEAGIAFLPGSDGLGISIRADAPECDLLIKLREVSAGASVWVSCSSKSSVATAEASSTADVPVVGPGPSRPGAYPRRRPRSPQEIERSRDEHTRRVLADAEATHQRRIADMGRYDQPVPAAAIPRSSFYNDDAPPLQWPSWLVQEGTNLPLKPVPGTADGKRYLECRYRTTLPMTRLYQFYEALFKANGLRIGTARLATGETLDHTVQNATGYVEAHRSEDGTVNGPSTRVRASFHRSYLNGPITVTLRVSVAGGFGRR
ncbi:MAG: hypothetical protein KIT09_05345 [Bryobacteraceae bacterium]|nr:hypothetical protein [Bryobacteraceae bacterium]